MTDTIKSTTKQAHYIISGNLADKLATNLINGLVLSALLYFRYANVNAVSLANNHLLDYGEKVVNSTIETLNLNNISYAGITFSTNMETQQVCVVINDHYFLKGLLFINMKDEKIKVYSFIHKLVFILNFIPSRVAI